MGQKRKTESSVKRKEIAKLAKKEDLSTSPSSLSKSTSSSTRQTDSQTRRDLHIRSEQRRREKIIDGFSKLKTMIPSIQSETEAKSSILRKTIDYIYLLHDHNRSLQLQCESLQNQIISQQQLISQQQHQPAPTSLHHNPTQPQGQISPQIQQRYVPSLVQQPQQQQQQQIIYYTGQPSSLHQLPQQPQSQAQAQVQGQHTYQPVHSSGQAQHLPAYYQQHSTAPISHHGVAYTYTPSQQSQPHLSHTSLHAVVPPPTNIAIHMNQNTTSSTESIRLPSIVSPAISPELKSRSSSDLFISRPQLPSLQLLMNEDIGSAKLGSIGERTRSI